MAAGTVNTDMHSAEYLNGHFIMPNQINLKKLVDWLLKYRDLDCDKDVLTYFTAYYIERKINKFYRSINNNAVSELETSLTILKDSQILKKYKEEIKKRKDKGVKNHSIK